MVKDSLGLEGTAKLAIFWWFIWFTRNQYVFKHIRYSAFATASRITNFLRDWNGAQDIERKLLPSNLIFRPSSFSPSSKITYICFNYLLMN